MPVHGRPALNVRLVLAGSRNATPDIRRPLPLAKGKLGYMTDCFEGIIDRFLLSCSEFERTLQPVRPEQWVWPTPCTEWNVRQLVNHVTRGNLNYANLVEGASAAAFLRLREVDALDGDPVGAFARSVSTCAEAFARPGALRRELDYPLGRVVARQALAVRTTDTTIHTWDLARSVGAEETLDPGLVAWIDDHLDEIYAGLSETPRAPDTTHRFFAAPRAGSNDDAPQQDRLLRQMGRTPDRTGR
ncbi:TIGR03086 family metal-binding protein [Nocardia sp. NBC_01503]|uniref:TIGR03086 family metal-binding protein n=1 Tax=Nocardia sp. NBC_01503 TaxID=2975997 RepID=UPI002E7B1E78|nr:TIGR03086 family metal-binding protein [Nocardia sp. NBC_01503]WTL32440.1 TIGR03086 family metal-binding protein [Nocardia sp. NBC_01503]